MEYWYDADGSLVLKARLPALAGGLLVKALEVALEAVPAREILVLPSGNVYLTRPPFSTYTTDDGWECIGVRSPFLGEYSSTRTLSSSARTFQMFDSVLHCILTH